MEACGYALRGGGIWYHVSSDLLEDKFIETHITVKCINYPVPISPAVSKLVGLESVAVGISGEVEPRACPTFTIAFGLKQTVHDLLVGVIAWVFLKLLYRIRLWGKAD